VASAQRARFGETLQGLGNQVIPSGQLQFPQAQPGAVLQNPFGNGQVIQGPGQVIQGPVLQGPVVQGPIIQGQQGFVVPQNVGPRVAPSPAFDPFRQNNAFPSFPGTGVQTQAPIFGGPIGQPAPVPQFQQPVFQPQQPIFQPQQPVFQPFQRQQVQQPIFNSPFQSSAPNTRTAWPTQAWARLRSEVIPRLLERPRFRATWLEGDEDHELDMTDIELATTMTFANWLGTSQPIRVSPGFIFHYWGGPDTATTNFDLPARAFSVYLASDYTTDPRQTGGFETNLTVGVYSDFHNTSGDAFRITGVGLGWLRVNSYTTFKFGVEYLDRVDVKLLPAVGVLLTPNPDLMINLYFPRPKVAQRLPRFGPFEVWSYVGGEYGGGSWAIERRPAVGPRFDDQVDINDARGFIGLEWMGPKRVTGFFEIGYAFDRELLYKSDQNNKLELQDTFMLRTGLAF
jgi:hypothetical protein